MPETKFLKCACSHCGGRIEFPAEGIGAMIPCPHCGRETELTLEAPPAPAAGVSSHRKWIIAGVVILLVGVVGVIGALMMANRLVTKARQRGKISMTTRALPGQARATNVINDFAVSDVAIGKKPGSTVVYAMGTLRNETDRQRYGVAVELDLFDSAGAKVGTAKDRHRDVIEPRAEWNFRALVVPKNAAAARVIVIREE